MGARADERGVRCALEATGWNRSLVARRLGVSRVTLWKRMRQLGLTPAAHNRADR